MGKLPKFSSPAKSKRFIRRGIERLERLEDAELRDQGTQKFQLNSFVAVAKGPQKGRAGRVVGIVRKRFGTKKDILLRISCTQPHIAKGKEILVSPSNLVQHK